MFPVVPGSELSGRKRAAVVRTALNQLSCERHFLSATCALTIFSLWLAAGSSAWAGREGEMQKRPLHGLVPVVVPRGSSRERLPEAAVERTKLARPKGEGNQNAATRLKPAASAWSGAPESGSNNHRATTAGSGEMLRL